MVLVFFAESVNNEIISRNWIRTSLVNRLSTLLAAFHSKELYTHWLTMYFKCGKTGVLLLDSVKSLDQKSAFGKENMLNAWSGCVA